MTVPLGKILIVTKPGDESALALKDRMLPFLRSRNVDAEWCATQPFGQRIAHGTLIFSVAVGMTAGDINPLAFSYGYDRLRFVKPVHIGDTLHCTVTIAEKREHKRPDHGVVVERLEAINQRGETVLACDHLLLAKRREV